MSCAGSYGLGMISLVAEIPAYLQGYNPRCIETAVKHIAAILQVPVDLNDLCIIADEFEKRVSETVKEQPQLMETIRKLEEDYDNEIFDTEMGDLKEWLQQQGIRVQVVIVEGRPHVQIAEFSESNQVDLIVMSTRGQSGVSRWLMGSVADRVVRGATVPVLLVRARKEDT